MAPNLNTEYRQDGNVGQYANCYPSMDHLTGSHFDVFGIALTKKSVSQPSHLTSQSKIL